MLFVKTLVNYESKDKFKFYQNVTIYYIRGNTMATIHIKTITKEEATKARLKAQRAARRLDMLHLKAATHEDKRTKRNRTRKAQKDKALKDSKE